MAQTSFATKRQNPRLSFFADAEVTLPSGRLVRAQLSELSVRGCYIDTLEAIPVDMPVDISISDGIRSCDVHGKVIYVHSGGGMGVFGMGVVFGSLGAEQQSAINGWMTATPSRSR